VGITGKASGVAVEFGVTSAEFTKRNILAGSEEPLR
jgi:hypothetical protein